MSSDLVPPDVRAVRKARMNSNIIKLCSTPKVASVGPVAQGIGLYTHIAGPKTATLSLDSESIDNTDREVALLPLGGPDKIQPNKFREPLNMELAALYKEMQDAVKAEEETWHDQRLAAIEKCEQPRDETSFSTLKKKYGASVSATLQHYDKDRDPRRRSVVVENTNAEVAKKRRVSFAPEPEPRRKSTGNVFMPYRRPNAERRESVSGSVYSRR